MSPVDAIIAFYESKAADAKQHMYEAGDDDDMQKSQYYRGLRDGYNGAIKYLRDLQSLFN